MKSNFYLPLLKSKAGEFKALENLNPTIKSKIIPLFDITKMVYDNEEHAKPRTIEDHLEKFCKKVFKSWPDNPMFIDTSMINTEKAGGTTAIEYLYSMLTKRNIHPMPVVYPSSSVEFIKSIRSILALYGIGEFAIRVTIDDITSSEFEIKLLHIMDKLKLSEGNCHIILDLKDADFTYMDDFAEAILESLSDFPYFKKWKTFTLAGGAFPAMSKIKNEVELVPRNDWKLYKIVSQKLKETSFGRVINFGDYSIVSAGHFEFDPKIMSISANIRYTHNDAWFVVKGRALKKRPDWQQYYSQADMIVKSKYYLGASFSFGDGHLRKCASRLTTTGNANVWIQMGTNHHFTKVLTDLFATSA
jgi:hypothetical protein